MYVPRRSWARVGRDTLPRGERAHRSARRREVRRLRWHFANTLAWLGARDVSSLDGSRQLERRGLLSALEAYALRGRFPRNEDRPDRFGPIFVDAAGRRCAMGHLLEVAGGAAIVERVALTANLAYVDELAADGELLDWLDRTGLTLEEAARIQPSYWCTPAELCLCPGWFFSSIQVLYEVVAEGPASGAGGAGGTDGAGGGGGAPPDGAVVYRVEAVHGGGPWRVGDRVTGYGSSEYLEIVIGERYLVTDSSSWVYPVYPFLRPGILDTTPCERLMGDAAILPDTAPAPAAIANLLAAVACGEGLPDPWIEPYGDCGEPSTVGAATSTATSTSASTSASSTAYAAVVGAGGAPSDGLGGGGNLPTTATGDPGAGAGSGGCGSCRTGGAADIPAGGAFVAAVMLGGAWLRRRRGPRRAAARPSAR